MPIANIPKQDTVVNSLSSSFTELHMSEQIKDGALKVALRWLLVLPASLFASGAAAWLFGVVTGLSYSINVIAAPNSIEQHFYAVAADFVYGWVFVSAGTATAPSHRPIVAIALICVLVGVMIYVMSNGVLKAGLPIMWAALRTAGYIGGASAAAWMAVLEDRTAKAPAASL